ncbi:hypothetical protein [Novosphingobium guangzhouense]|uniref:Uncharacterized protein n=1 Tax=Novosphingobium guangzhouense TaxID=1850347 RepID=A0A2K2FSQ6_9SPHN|nr:hypothetical protein [Novosphingobium guangzhouense]PNU01816.1 hypothetical protein A8V01_12225 [Novosphingobium guangzhouense]
MVDILALAISHGLLLLAAWRLLWRPDLDSDGGDAESRSLADRVRARRAPMRVNRPADGGSEEGRDA